MNILLFASLLVAISAAPSEDSYGDRAVYINGRASAFEKIIKSHDVRTQDPIHLTPAVVLIGKENGTILRCLQEDPNECETFYKTDSDVWSLLITGEYFYAGLGSGAILRCELSVKESCSTFHTCTPGVMSLEVVGGYLYAGLYDKSIMRCELDQVNSCRLLHTMEHKVFALISYEDHIYAGLKNAQLMRCSLRAKNTCSLIYTLDTAIMGFANFGNSLIAVTSNGYLWTCTQKSASNTDYCVKTTKLRVGTSQIWYAATYKGVLYVVNEEGIYICNSANGTDCLNYARHIGALSIALSYSTYHMQSRYKGEHTTCTWQNNHRCPPFVTYYQPQQRSMLEVHVKDGKLRNSVGNLVDTSSNDDHSGAAIFAMGPDGRLLLTNVHVPQLIHTSSLFAGNPVAGAGEMVVENGVIKNMTTCSVHYRPDLALNRQVVESLRAQGYTVAIDSQECREDEEMWPILPQ